MSLSALMSEMLPEIEEALKENVYQDLPMQYGGLVKMLAYHMGWENSGGEALITGKRIRPVMLLIALKLINGEWEKGLPAAAAVELLHNFSLIHDDIEDQSEFRHGRQTVWKIWGMAHAINGGDAMFSLAQLAILKLGNKIGAEAALEAARVFNMTCISLTGGQYLDMSFENVDEIARDDYFQMVSGKTAALLAAANELGGVIGQASISNRNCLRAFGESLGLAFQAQDDYLGIWGDEILTGKSNSSDLKSGKKTLPVVYALEKQPELAEKFRNNPESDDEIRQRINELEALGAKDYTEKVVNHYSQLAQQSLNSLKNVDQEALQALAELTDSLIGRKR